MLSKTVQILLLIVAVVLLIIAAVLLTSAAHAGESTPLPEGTIPLSADPPPPAKKRCLHGHWTVPIPILIQRADGAVSVQVDLCPICILNELQRRAGYPPARK